jgi:hypothetical protein
MIQLILVTARTGVPKLSLPVKALFPKSLRKPLKPTKAGILTMVAIFGLIGAVTVWSSFAADINLSKGDLNKDGVVNASDLGILISAFGQNSAAADTDEDGAVTVIDLSKVLSNQGMTITAPASPLPSAPSNLHTTTVSYIGLNLAWNGSTAASGIARYNIYRNGVLLTNTTFLSHTDSHLSQGSSYTYTVSAVDNSGNESAQSTAVSATTAIVKPAPPAANDTTLNVRTFHFSAYHKARLGWLNPANGVEYVQTVRPGQTVYKIGQSETMDGTTYPKLVRVPHRVSGEITVDYLYLEFRQPYGFDATIYPEAVTGVSLRQSWGLKVPIKPYLLDTHATASDDYFDAPMQPGEQFADVKSGVTIKVLGVIPGQYATVEITGQTQEPKPAYCGGNCAL